jgi:prevent-host-death family protein
MLQKTVNIHEAKTHLSQLLQFAAQGNEVVICKAGEPIARLTSANSNEPLGERPLGLLADKIQIGDDFNEMPEWFNAYFEAAKCS